MLANIGATLQSWSHLNAKTIAPEAESWLHYLKYTKHNNNKLSKLIWSQFLLS